MSRVATVEAIPVSYPEPNDFDALRHLCLVKITTDDGVAIMVVNRGVRYGKPEVMERLAKGEKVDPAEIYCRTVATFEAPRDSKYEWMNHTLIIGQVDRTPDSAIVRFYKVN